MVNKEKQIEEIAKVLNECCNDYDVNGRHIRNKCNPYDCEYWSEDNHCCCSYNKKEAEALYAAGYRKASEVAEEIFAEIEKCRLIAGRAFFGGRIACYLKDDIDELKKKFTEADDGT